MLGVHLKQPKDPKKAQKCEKPDTKHHRKDTRLQYKLLAETRRLSFVCSAPAENVSLRQLKLFTVLRVSMEDYERAASIDLGVTNKC